MTRMSILILCLATISSAAHVPFSVDWECVYKEETSNQQIVKETPENRIVERIPKKCKRPPVEEKTRGKRTKKVIAYSLYKLTGNGYDMDMEVWTERYWSGLEINIKTAKEMYPNWEIWIYYRGIDPGFVKKYSTPRYSHLRWFNMDGHPLQDYTMCWRFTPWDDPTVERFMSRDADSLLLLRERAAVAEWEDSGKVFHLMRDHPQHSIAMLGGMWGAAPPVDTLALNMTKAIMSYFSRRHYKFKGSDQDFLGSIFSRVKSYGSLQHDDFICSSVYGKPSANALNEIRQFPLPYHMFEKPDGRVGGRFVGAVRYINQNRQWQSRCKRNGFYSWHTTHRTMAGLEH